MMKPRRPYRTVANRILSLLATGPRKRTVLLGVAGAEKRLKSALSRLMAADLVVMQGQKRGTLYALSSATNRGKKS